MPIGYGQTISQPLIVALMTDILNVDRTGVVLEVGTGSGYQAAVAAELVGQVYTIEIIPDLARSAADRLRRLGYTNVTVRVGDGYFRWPEAAPTASAAHIPPPLLQQLKPGGRMVIPVSPALGQQHLTVVERSADGRVRTRRGRDFSRHYKGYLTVDEISQLDDLTWIQVTAPRDLRSFRDGEFGLSFRGTISNRYCEYFTPVNRINPSGTKVKPVMLRFITTTFLKVHR